MKELVWRLKSKGFRLISAFISREGKRTDKIFASVEKDGIRYNYDGRTLMENNGIEGEVIDIDKINISEIEEHCPDSRHMILVSRDFVKVLIPLSPTSLKVIELTHDGKVVREYETDIGGI